jgi:biotin transport system substrate-specific component
MFNDQDINSTWIESFLLKKSDYNNFSVLNKIITAIICSFLLIISAKIKVDLYPVPMTLQPLAVLMISMLCGRSIAVGSIGLYLFQGIIGLPVFAYGGGFQYLMGPTGGFLFGFLISGFVIGYLADEGWGKGIIKSIIAMILGLFIIYFCGIIQLSVIKGFDYAILKGMEPFILGDLYKILFAALILPQIWKFTK